MQQGDMLVYIRTSIRFDPKTTTFKAKTSVHEYTVSGTTAKFVNTHDTFDNKRVKRETINRCLTNDKMHQTAEFVSGFCFCEIEHIDLKTRELREMLDTSLETKIEHLTKVIEASKTITDEPSRFVELDKERLDVLKPSGA